MTDGRKLDKPGIYQIRVKGVLDEKWSEEIQSHQEVKWNAK
jgi:hypothetical protein